MTIRVAKIKSAVFDGWAFQRVLLINQMERGAVQLGYQRKTPATNVAGVFDLFSKTADDIRTGS
jgi:hypothetical protein